MYKQLIYIGCGIYGLILSFGFISLSLLRQRNMSEVNGIEGELIKRIMINSGLELSNVGVAGDVEFKNIRVVEKSNNNIEKVKLFPFLESQSEKNSNHDTEILKQKVEDTEIINSKLDDTELLEQIIEDTEILEAKDTINFENDTLIL